MYVRKVEVSTFRNTVLLCGLRRNQRTGKPHISWFVALPAILRACSLRSLTSDLLPLSYKRLVIGWSTSSNRANLCTWRFWAHICRLSMGDVMAHKPSDTQQLTLRKILLLCMTIMGVTNHLLNGLLEQLGFYHLLLKVSHLTCSSPELSASPPR